MKIKGTTKLVGVLGYPVRHSLSPVFQNAAFQHLKMDWVYVPCEVKPEDLKTAIEGLQALGFVGVNVTIPYKKEVIFFLNALDSEARALGSVNTIKFEKSIRKGYSTDGVGFIRSLKEEGKFNPQGKTVFLIGAGGSAYAVGGTLIRAGIKKIFICNRTWEKAVNLAEYLGKTFSFREIELVEFCRRHRKSIWESIDLLVNTTSVGLKGREKTLVKPENMRPGLFVYDLIYNRLTKLLHTAKRLNLPHLNGISMLIYQGASSFEIWTGRRAPVEVMKNSLGQIPAFAEKRE